ncbi:mannose-1-phosphate guanylyltransferase [Cohnella sp. CIP 111063]|uniref:nucleotidyltransferase family protein n=1 Tax=unclassified Cohnella TaxID=2636738 RepID=UPI000B8BD173|nr:MULTISPECIES: NDP-sugar synthase [unclassified Cohnella]OXS56169.1 mannose-1-phosphate guanylyltransferase [Cohnella sp. CIP 111063]PRX67804.1 nucleotidyltransferase [Cohnella sp. SGD-V74]
MKALLLAGGLGTRLRPLTEHLPKPMALVGNRPWLEHLLLHYKEQGVNEFVIAVKHYRELIESYLGDGSKYGVRIDYSVEKELLGTAGAIKNAERLLSDRFVVVNADIIHQVNLTAALRYHEEHGGAVTICLTEVEDPSHYGVVEQTDGGRIVRFTEKPKKEEAPSNRINAGIYIMERRALDFVPAGKVVSIEKETFPLLIDNGSGVYGHPIGGYWMDMGTKERYRQLHWDLLDRRFPLRIDGKEMEDKSIWLGDNVRVGQGVLFIPPVMIGDDVTIGDRAIIGPYAVVGKGSRIGKQVRLANSILWDRCKIRAGAQLNECIFGTAMQAGPHILHEAVCNRNLEVQRR